MKPPFRADQVGSLLRPAELAEARAKAKRGELDAAGLRAVEDRCIRAAIEKQASIGLQAVTDGEFRRDWWHVDFLAGFEGVEGYVAPLVVGFKDTEEQPPMIRVTGKVKRTKPIFVDSFKFMKSAVVDPSKHTAKQTIPAPAMLHLRPGRSGISKAAYPDLAEFWQDVGAAYRAEIKDLGAAGCTYLQLDDTSFAYLCDDKFAGALAQRGDDPKKLAYTYAEAINAAVADRPQGMAITMHTCRGNFKSTWVASGGYEPVVEALFSANVDGFFMEFDSERAGTFEPLRFVPKGKKVVLGLVTTKFGELEDKDTIKRRIAAAAKFVPLEDLCLSPQCGFSSTHHGNNLSQDDQWRKLERIVEVAREVWG
jgi:5-methyltetrahydropteroyltriglutamate--homocysteine methyltransferase